MAQSTVQIEWTPPDGGDTQVLDFDAVTSEKHDEPVEVTEHAVESGAAVSDHARPGPDTVTLECVVTNTPIVTPFFGMDGARLETQRDTLQAGGQSVGVSVLRPTQPV